jgi:ABC-type multidrug transport system ATPase subunit
MKGTLRIMDRAGDRAVPLPRERCSLGNGPADPLRIETEGAYPSVASLEWEARRATWLFCCASERTVSIAVNGRMVASTEPIALNHLDTIEVADVTMQFLRVLAEPQWNGVPCAEVKLTPAGLVFGREHPEFPPGPTRVALDAEDSSVSRKAASIAKEGPYFFLSHDSGHGVELNGLNFKREQLVFGDRFRISGYIFEFTGRSVVRIQPELAGTVEARDLTVIAGGRKILDGVSVTIGAGEFIGVLGRSGQGKSTLLNALCGVNPATSGEVRIGGVPLADRAKLRELGIGYVPQDDIVHKELTVVQAVTYSARLRLRLPRLQIAALVERILAQLGLTAHAHKRVAQLSGGQRKRVSIAIELLAKPSVLFLDEPSSGLDPAAEVELMTLLQSLTLTKLTVICTTHVLHKAYLFDEMLFVEGGKLVFAGDSDNAREHFLLGEASATSTETSYEHAPLEAIYTLLQKHEKAGTRTAVQWEDDFRASRFARNAERLIPPLDVLAEDAAPREPKPKVGFFKTLATLARRQWSILHSEWLNLVFLLAQPVLIGLLVGWVADETPLRLFLCIVATMWFGCSNGAQQIVAELPIFRRERVCGQGMNAYVLSKLGFLSAISLVQGMVLLVTTIAFAQVFHGEKGEAEKLEARFTERLTPPAPAVASAGKPAEEFELVDDSKPPAGAQPVPAPAEAAPAPPPAPGKAKVRALVALCEFLQITQNVLDTGPRLLLKSDGETVVTDAKGAQVMLPGLPVGQVIWTALGLRLLAIMAATIVSAAIGLTISSLVKNTTQAVLWVPLVLIPQILFGGIVVAVPEMTKSVRTFSKVMPSYAAQRIMDVGAVFGLSAPSVSNRTKLPIFLSPLGEKENIEWTEKGDTRSQTYDKISPVNASWRNLAVIADWRGEHKAVLKRVGDDHYVERDSVDGRRDVLVRKGVPYRSLAEARTALATLGAWLALCYVVTLFGLFNKQTGK